MKPPRPRLASLIGTIPIVFPAICLALNPVETKKSKADTSEPAPLKPSAAKRPMPAVQPRTPSPAWMPTRSDAGTQGNRAEIALPHRSAQGATTSFTPRSAMPVSASPAAVRPMPRAVTTFTPHASTGTANGTTTSVPHADGGNATTNDVPRAATSGATTTYTPHANHPAPVRQIHAASTGASGATTYVPHAKSAPAGGHAPNVSHVAVVAVPVAVGVRDAGDAPSCDDYPLQSIGSGPQGTVCRCAYGPAGEVGWWSVKPGSGSSDMEQCGPPGSMVDAAPAEAPRVMPAAPATTTYVPHATSTQSPPASASRPRQPAPAQPAPQSSYTHRGDVVADNSVGAADQYGRAPNIYEVSVTNTGETTLYCTADAKAQTYNQNVTCTGAGDSGCANLQSWSTNHGSAYVEPGNTSRVVGVRYYVGSGSYSVSCKTDQ